MIKLINRICILALAYGEFIVIKQYDSPMAIAGFTIMTIFAIATFMSQEKKEEEGRMMAMKVIEVLNSEGKIKIEKEVEMENE